MNILVCLKLISQAQFADLLNDSDDRLSGGDLSFNPADMYALELALRVKEEQPQTMVTVMTMAPDCAKQALRETLAMGADQAILISDSRISGSDTMVTARILSAAVRKLPQQDLILCGRKTLDSETGHVGPQLSTFLSLPLASNVISFSLSDRRIEVVRAADSGIYRYTGDFPCVLSICNGNEMIRKPTIAGLRRSKDVPITVFHLSDLGICPTEVGVEGSPTKTVSISSLSFRHAENTSVTDILSGLEGILGLLRQRMVTENE